MQDWRNMAISRSRTNHITIGVEHGCVTRMMAVWTIIWVLSDNRHKNRQLRRYSEYLHILKSILVKKTQSDSFMQSLSSLDGEGWWCGLSYREHQVHTLFCRGQRVASMETSKISSSSSRVRCLVSLKKKHDVRVPKCIQSDTTTYGTNRKTK